MFRQTVFNQDISSWDVSNVEDMRDMFFSNTSFNQPIGSWNTSSLTSITQMLRTASAFDQDLSNWVVTGITVATDFMTSAGLSQENYEKTLSGWAAQSADLQAGVSISFGNSVPNAAASGYKETLTGVGWTITDSVGTIP
jgi:surface protein